MWILFCRMNGKTVWSPESAEIDFKQGSRLRLSHNWRTWLGQQCHRFTSCLRNCDLDDFVMEFNMTDKMFPPQTYSTLPCSRQSRTLLNPFGLAYSSRPVLPCYAHGRLNKVNSTPRSTQRGEGSVSLLASQTRQPHHTSDSGPASTSAETRPAKEMVGTLRSHSNNAVTRTPQKPPQVPLIYTTIGICFP